MSCSLVKYPKLVVCLMNTVNGWLAGYQDVGV
jgi:hypothetical protein